MSGLVQQQSGQMEFAIAKRADRKGGSSDDRSVRGDHAKGHERNKKSTLLSALA